MVETDVWRNGVGFARNHRIHSSVSALFFKTEKSSTLL
jgi:hypothetical protein